METEHCVTPSDSEQPGAAGVKPITSFGTVVGPEICKVMACVAGDTYAGWP